MLPPLTYTLSEALIAGNSVSGMLSVKNSDVPGTHDIERGTLSISSGNYAITYINGILTVTANSKSTPINADNFSEGLNSNFSSTIQGVQAAWLDNSGKNISNMFNPYTMNYSELVSLEPKNIDERYTDKQPISIHDDEKVSMFRSMTPETSRNVEIHNMSIDNPTLEMGSSVTGNTNLAHIRGFASGSEIRIEQGVESEFSLDFVAPPFLVQRSLFEGQSIRTEDFLPEGYDVAFTADPLLKKSNVFKNDYERLLDELMVSA